MRKFRTKHIKWKHKLVKKLNIFKDWDPNFNKSFKEEVCKSRKLGIWLKLSNINTGDFIPTLVFTL